MICAAAGMTPAAFDDLWPWEIDIVVGGYARRLEDDQWTAWRAAHALAGWVWAAWAGKLKPLDELVLTKGSTAQLDPEARTARDEARWSAWAATVQNRGAQ